MTSRLEILEKGLVKLGSATSGNYRHKGNPPNRGGSSPGGGHRAIGVTAGMSREAVEELVGRHRQEQKVLSSFSPEVREVLANDIRGIQGVGIRNNREYASAFTEHGTRVNGVIEGNEDSADVDKLLTGVTDVLIHNHPSSSSFSGEDIGVLFLKGAPNHLVVVGHDGTLYRASKTSRTPDIVVTTAREKYLAAKSNLMEKFRPRVVSGEISRDVAWKQHSHETMIDLANQLNLKYQRVER